MQFYEKLIFLQNLLQITNRMLAHELQVDPSLISRLRTGARGVPRNREHLKTMSSYFARRCNTEYQRKALSDVLGIKQALTAQEESLADILYCWLSEESTDGVGRFMRTFESLDVEDKGSVGSSAPYNPSADNAVYYGNDGKRAAVRALYQHLRSLESPCTVYVMTDEADNWITEDYEFYQELQSWWMGLANLGFYFCYIAPPVSPVDLAFESLIRWIPVYMTGQAAAYFYPRLRDQVHRRTLVVVPGRIALISNSMAHQTTATATILTSDQRLTQTYLAQFQDYLSMCRPMLHTYTTHESLMHCFTRFLSMEGARIQKVPSLSADTAPPELIARCMEHMTQPDLDKLQRFYLQEFNHLKENRDNSEFIDITYLASADEVRKGTVPILLSYGSDSSPLYYTPETYCLHLKNILHILETRDHYHFIPIGKDRKAGSTLMVKEGQKALIVHRSHDAHDFPLSVIEISQPEIVQLCQEHLLLFADRIGYADRYRIKIMSQIKERIKELQE